MEHSQGRHDGSLGPPCTSIYMYTSTGLHCTHSHHMYLHMCALALSFAVSQVCELSFSLFSPPSCNLPPSIFILSLTGCLLLSEVFGNAKYGCQMDCGCMRKPQPAEAWEFSWKSLSEFVETPLDTWIAECHVLSPACIR